MNAYEAARERFQDANAELQGAKEKAERILREAEEEWDAAEANLRQYETSPGVPLPQFRAEVSA